MRESDKYSIILVYEGRLGSSRADSTYVLENASYFSQFIPTSIWTSRRKDWHIPHSVKETFHIISFGRAFNPKTLFSSIFHQLLFGLHIRTKLRSASKKRDVIPVLVFHDWWPLISLVTFRRKKPFLLVLEVHRSLPKPLIQFGAFSHIDLLIATNKFKFYELREYFEGKMIYERNAVGLSAYSEPKRVTYLPKNSRKSVLYTGSLGPEKNPDILLAVSAVMPDIDFYIVGTTPAVWGTMKLPPNLFLLGPKPHSEISGHQLDADMLLVTLDSHDTQSSLYTSTMKLFEYIAARRPIIAPNLPSIIEVLSPEEFYPYQANDVNSLRAALALASQQIDNPKLPSKDKIDMISWKDRNQRIISEIKRVSNLRVGQKD